MNMLICQQSVSHITRHKYFYKDYTVNLRAYTCAWTIINIGLMKVLHYELGPHITLVT